MQFLAEAAIEVMRTEAGAPQFRITVENTPQKAEEFMRLFECAALRFCGAFRFTGKRCEHGHVLMEFDECGTACSWFEPDVPLPVAIFVISFWEDIPAGTVAEKTAREVALLKTPKSEMN